MLNAKMETFMREEKDTRQRDTQITICDSCRRVRFPIFGLEYKLYQ